MAEVAVEIDDLTKDFSLGWRGMTLRAVDHLNLQIPQNRVFGLIGPNGSGKSTTLKLLLGLLRPTTGRTLLFGKPSVSARSRKDLGYLPESPDFHRFLTGRELVHFFGKLSGMGGSELTDRTQVVMERVGLRDAAGRRVDTYSKGMLQRLGLAQALVHDPMLLILDEPTAGVDPMGAEAIANLIRQIAEEGKTVLLCSHLLTEVEQLCDAVAILFRGKCLLEGRLERLLEKPDRHIMEISGFNESDLQKLKTWLTENGMSLEGPPRRFRHSLEDLFLETARAERRKEQSMTGVNEP